MNKTVSLLLLGTMLLGVLCSCQASAETHTGEAEGYGGKLVVSVTMNGEDITQVKVTSHQETQGVGTRAIEALPAAIVQADSIDVDSVAGATVTSQAIKEAVSQAMGVGGVIQQVVPINEKDAAMAPQSTILRGTGMASTGRVGPGKDEDGGQVYSVNIVFAAGEFDEDGRIRAMTIDQAEIVTPNLGGGSAFSGFPSSVGDEERFLNEVSRWQTKGAMGEDYMLPGGTWRQQMDWYEQQMAGKTVEEVKTWYAAQRGTPSEDGEPAATAQPDAEAGASITLEGEYGDILLAVERAWEDARQGQAREE